MLRSIESVSLPSHYNPLARCPFEGFAIEAKCSEERNQREMETWKKEQPKRETSKILPDIREAPSSSLAPGSALLPANRALDMMPNFNDGDAVDEL